jgi:hypothetical protein
LPAVSYLKAPAYRDGHPGVSDAIDEQYFLVNESQLGFVDRIFRKGNENGRSKIEVRTPPPPPPQDNAADSLNANNDTTPYVEFHQDKLVIIIQKGRLVGCLDWVDDIHLITSFICRFLYAGMGSCS